MGDLRFRQLNQNRSKVFLSLILTLIAACSTTPLRRSTVSDYDVSQATNERRAREGAAPVRHPAAIDQSEIKGPPYEKFMWPISKHRISRGFKDDEFGRPHDGVDIPAPRGTRVFAPAEGTVLYAGKRFRGYGRMIIIEHDDSFATIYGHLDKILVRSGESVHKGSLIGYVGRTGRASAPHLHFEVRVNKKPVDPVEYLP